MRTAKGAAILLAVLLAGCTEGADPSAPQAKVQNEAPCVQRTDTTPMILCVTITVRK